MNLQLAKGTRDFSPEEKIARDKLTRTLTTMFERYGYSPLETPIIERLDVLGAKYAGGEGSDVMKEVFALTDQGERALGLRFDLTVPLARYIGMNPQTKMPFKRYQVGPVFRDGPIKAGRYRQFWQYDIDIIGASSMKADAEIVRLTLAVFKELGIEVEVRINNRKLLTTIIEKAGISTELSETVIITIDKLDKIGAQGVTSELLDKGFDKEQAQKVLSLLEKRASKEELLRYYEEQVPCAGVQELKELFDLLPNDDQLVFLPSLARGLAYYTGTVVEVYSKNKELNFSLAGGGRYDNMIGSYLGGKQLIPAVGLAFGFEPILDVLKLKGTLTMSKSLTQLYVIPIGNVTMQTLVEELRAAGINTDVDLMNRGVSKNIQYAQAYGIPYVLFVGEDEQKNGKYKLKNLESGDEQPLSYAQIVELLA